MHSFSIIKAKIIKTHKARAGQWHMARDNNSADNLTKEQKQALQQLRSVGYLAGSQQAPHRQNITVYDKTKAYIGLNLVVSGHAPEAILMDMEGREVHKWNCDVFRAWPEFNPEKHYGKYVDTSTYTYWRRAHLMENGDLLAIFSGVGLIKLDKNSNLLWSTFNGAHHDLYVAKNGNIYVLTRKAHINKKYNSQKPILEDFICVLDSEGQKLQEISIFDVLENSHFAPVLRKLPAEGDILHTNTIEFIEKQYSDNPTQLKKGTVLISLCRPSLVCAVDLERRSVYWGESDLWTEQHQPTLLANGNILVFDNNGLKGRSTVLEFDPSSRDVQWYYRGNGDNTFYTHACGSCQRLPNGNTLITESDPGRAFEVTHDKEIVWEYVNPHRAGEENELIATLFEVVRLRETFPTDWLP